MTPQPTPSHDSAAVDQAFARFARRGDPTDLATVLDAVAPGLLRVALHLTGDPNAAEDLVQETFVASIEARRAFAAGSGVEQWLLGILRNRARRAWRARSRTAAAARSATDAGDPVSATLAAELSAEVDAAIQELPETYRSVLRLHLRNQLTAADIALALERPPGSVRTQIVRGLELLRQRLPRGLAVGALALVLAPRGLHAMRSAVLETAAAVGRTAPIAASTATVVRAGAAKTVTLVALFAAVASLAALAAGTSSGNAAVPVAASTDRHESSAARIERGRSGEAALAQQERELLATTAQGKREYGTVLVRASWAEDNAPAAGVTVRLCAFGQANEHLLTRTGLTGPRGTVRIAHVPVGEISALTDVSDCKIHVEADRECVVDVQSKHWARVTGTVVDADGKPVAGASVMRSDYGNPQAYAVAITDQAGRFAIEIGEARYLGARCAGHVDSCLAYLPLKKGETSDVTLQLRGPAASVAGTVRDVEGRPVPHALVRLLSAGGVHVELPGGRSATSMSAPPAESDDEGRFRIDGLEPGPRVPFLARAIDFGVWRGACTLVAGETQTLDVTLRAGGIIEGHVLDAAGKPIPNARLIAQLSQVPQYPDFTTCTAQSAADGSFRLDSLPDGAVALRAVAHLLGRAETMLRLPPGATANWEARLEAQPAIVGRVVDEHDKPRPGFIVEAESYDTNGSRQTNAVTDAEGRFRLGGLRDEPLRVNLFASYRDIASLHVEDARPGTADLVLRVPDRALPSARLHGRIVGPDGRTPPGAQVELWQGRGGMGPGFAIDDASGAFTLGPVPPGDYRVVATARDRPRVHRGAIHLDAGAALDLGTLEVGAAGSLRASLFDEAGQPVPDGAHDYVAILTPAGDNVIGVMVHDGKARIDALTPGPYLALWRATLQPFAIARDAATDLVLRPQPRATCALTLRETDARKAERPRDHYEVDVLDAGGRLLDRVQLFERNRAGDSWPCEVLAVPGSVTIVVLIEGHERARRTLVLRPGAEIALD